MTAITLQSARQIVDAALAAGRERGAAPLTVAVLDSGGHLVALAREDGSGILRPEIAAAKAWGALGMGVPSGALADKSERFLTAVAALSGGRVVPVPGGILVRAPDSGAVIGAVGISGDASQVDEACAVAGVRAAGLRPEAGP